MKQIKKVIILIIFFSVKFNLFAEMDTIKISVENYHYSQNLLVFQLKIENFTNNYAIIRGYTSTKYELMESKLILSYYYSYPGLEELAFVGLLENTPSFIIKPNEISYFSTYVVNETIKVINPIIVTFEEYMGMINDPNTYLHMENDEKYLTYNSFEKIRGIINSVEINFEIITNIDENDINDFSYSMYKKYESNIIQFKVNYELNEPIIIDDRIL